jgi:hypothetical protein
MLNPLFAGPALIRRALADLGAIGHAARQVEGIRVGVIGRLDTVNVQLDRLRDDVAPLRQLGAVREQLANVRAGIEPLDEDMRHVREAIEAIEPFVSGLDSAVQRIDGKLASMGSDLTPVADLAEKMPGVSRP